MKMLKITLITTALLATSPLFANTSVNATADIKTEQPSILHNVTQGVKDTTHKAGHGIQNTAVKVDHGVEKGVDKTRNVTKNAWENTKDFSAEKSQAVENKAKKVKDATVKKADQTKTYASEKWQKGKDAVSSHSGDAHVNGKTNVELNTPAAKANVDISREAGIGHSK
ncbi:hypothetical protein AMQ28_06305 [Acinetobacter sp. TTH0-4]|uniref:hypothetical protein n=1 Tax=Acinetobacter sp. TTH0-4 TaxID=1646498 RepID=UPI0006AEE29F|nr:hypothetical protein [Acinetobacter sp. TTH0-4]ALD02012.1 hypothetical protein AMQ28_06305 [Acinetobacter sp. TTH0-4]